MSDIRGPNITDLTAKKRMVKIERDGSYCIFRTLEEALEEVNMHYSDGYEGDSFTWTNVEMSQLEFDALPEFQGW